MMSLFSILFLCCLLPTFIHCKDGEGSFSSKCNSSKAPCNHTALLKCFEGKCECILPESMTYLEVKSKCVSLIDEPCGHIVLGQEEIELDCVPQGFCSEQGYCQCLSPFFFSNITGQCEKQKDFGEDCTSEIECDGEKGLSCINGTCICNPKRTIESLKFERKNEMFDSSESESIKCLGKASSPCTSNVIEVGKEGCIPHAECSRDNKCLCMEGYEESLKGLCLGTFNKSCNVQKNLLCRKDLVCLNGLCGCLNPRDEVWEEGRCLTLVGGRCSVSQKSIGLKEGTKCVANAKCSRNKGRKRSCECSLGFVETGLRTCEIGHGGGCTLEDPSSGCDILGGLVCREGVCSCEDPSGQIVQEGRCRGVKGSFCLKDRDCVLNGHCLRRRNGLLLHGECECNEGFKYNGNEETCEEE